MLKQLEQIIQIGEKILVASNLLSFGTKPGFLDKFLGEADVRRMVLDQKNIDPISEEYRALCEKAYNSFREKFKSEDGFLNEKSFEKALKKIDRIYYSRLKEAEEKDEVNWNYFTINSLMISARLAGITEKIYDSSNNLKISEGSNPTVHNSLSSRVADIYSNAIDHSDFVSISSPIARSGIITDYNDFYLESPAQTFTDAINYLTEKAGGVSYALLIIGASISQNPILRTVGIAGAILSKISTSEATTVENRDYKTTVYCGPRISCEYIKKFIEEDKLKLIEFDQGQIIDSEQRNFERLVVIGHGNKMGNIETSSMETIQPDDFAKKYFPDVKIIHAFGCQIGANMQNNFGKNNLTENQILFLHAGDANILMGIVYEKLSHFLSYSNEISLSPEPLQIIFKQTESSSINTSVVPASVKEIKDLISSKFHDPSSSQEDLIDEIYDLIRDTINEQRQKVLNDLDNISQESKDLINSELERLGIARFLSDEIEEKEVFVRSYINKMLMTPKHFSYQDILFFKQYDLFDINQQLQDGTTLVLIMAEHGSYQVLEALAKNGADLNKARNDGITPALIAAQYGQYQALEVLARYGADLNKAKDDGTTPVIEAVQQGRQHSDLPVFISVQQGHYRSLEVLTRYGADLNKARNDGATPAFIAAEMGQYLSLEFLARNGADLSKARNDGVTPTVIAARLGQNKTLEVLVKNGANRETEISSNSDDKSCQNEYKEEKKLEMKKEYSDKISPKTSVKKVAHHNVREKNSESKEL